MKTAGFSIWKKLPGESLPGSFAIKAMVGLLVFICLTVAYQPEADRFPGIEKVDPRVLADSSFNQAASYLVLLKGSADLTTAEELPPGSGRAIRLYQNLVEYGKVHQAGCCSPVESAKNHWPTDFIHHILAGQQFSGYIETANTRLFGG